MIVGQTALMRLLSPEQWSKTPIVAFGFDLLGMNFQNGETFTPRKDRKEKRDTPIKSAWPEECWIELIQPVGGGQEDNNFLRLSKPSISAELVERLFPFSSWLMNPPSPCFFPDCQFSEQ